MAALTVCAVVPAPMACEGVAVKEERVLSVPHSSHAFVACAFGFTVPLSIALRLPISVAAVVATVGAGDRELEPPPPPPHEYKVNTKTMERTEHVKFRIIRRAFFIIPLLMC